MATNTANYNLVKPSGAPGGDLVDIAVIDSNMDIIDGALHAHDLTNTAEDTRLTNLELTALQTIIKPADESVISSVALQNDDHFFFNVLANKQYEFDLFLMFTTVNSAIDGKVGFAFPAGALSYGEVTMDPAVAAGQIGSGQWVAVNAAISGTSAISIGVGAGPTVVLVKGTVLPTADGVVTFMWAQNASTATALTLLKGSKMQYRRVAV